MKQVYTWLQLLEEPHRSKALANMWWEDQLNWHPTLQAALYQAFNWSRSPEGYKYWKAVSDNIPHYVRTN
jgi:hypothetical protein